MKSKTFQFSGQKSGSFFHFTENLAESQNVAFSNPNANHIFWNLSKEEIEFFCDDKIIRMPKSTFCTITALNYLRLKKDQPPLSCISFNREFYCIRDHDHEVSCNGILFYGAQSFSVLSFSEAEGNSFRNIIDLFHKEFLVNDPVQEEMLVSLLKILIIHLTRIGRNKIKKINGTYKDIEVIRQFNLLVELNFKKNRLVSDYAFLLGIQPKKLSEILKSANLNSPLVIIHNRIILEAKRLLLFSLKPIKEISDELGFDDISQFTKLFKKYVKESPSQFRAGKTSV